MPISGIAGDTTYEQIQYPPDARPDAELLLDVMADGWTYSQRVPYPVQAVGLWPHNRETLWRRLGALA